MQSIFALLGTIAIQNDEALAALDETSQRAENTSEQTNNAFKGIGTAALAVGKVVLTAGAALGGAWIAAIEGTREYRNQMGMLDTAFQVSGHNAGAARQTYSDLNAVLGDSGQATEAAQQLAKLADNEEDLSTLTHILTGVYATFGESLPIEGLAEGINHSAKLGEVQGSLADALEWSGITVEGFNEKLAACSTEQERQDLIVKTLNDTYSKAGTQYKETNKDVMAANRAQEKLTNAFAEFGRVGEPILTAIKDKTADMVQAAVPKVESFIKKVKDLSKWVKDNESTIDKWVAVIIGASVSIGSFLLIMKWGAIMTAAKNAILAVRAAMLLLNAAMKANLIGLVVSLIAGLVAAFLYLWKNNEGFRNFWINMWSKIKSVSGSAVSWIKDRFGDLKGAVATARNTFDSVKKAISDKIGAARDAVKKAIDKIKGFFKFSWSLPKLKMPSFTIKGKFSLDPPSVPKIGIKWNAAGAVLTRPTIFGSIGNTLLGGGEAGNEAIAPIGVLQGYVRDAVRAENEGVSRVLIDQFRLLLDFLEQSMPHTVRLDSGALVGELVPAIDARMADRLLYASRGNVR